MRCLLAFLEAQRRRHLLCSATAGRSCYVEVGQDLAGQLGINDCGAGDAAAHTPNEIPKPRYSELVHASEMCVQTLVHEYDFHCWHYGPGLVDTQFSGRAIRVGN